MPQGAGFFDVTARRLDAVVAVFRRTARANAHDARAGAVTRPQRPRRVATFTGATHVWEEKEAALPIAAMTGVNDGAGLTLTNNQALDLPPIDLAGPK
jgi:hypothetical protein